MDFSLRPSCFVGQIIAFLAVFMVISGCVTSSEGERWKPVVRHNGNQVHVVKWDDETLPAIARWYSGSADQIETIANANPTLDVDHVRVGDRIFIPQNIRKTRREMSRAFLDTFLSTPPPKVQDGGDTVMVAEPRIIAPKPYKKKIMGADVELTPAPVHLDDAVSRSQTDQVSTPQPRADEPDLPLFGPR